MKCKMFGKSILTKLIAVITTVAIVLTLAPVNGIFNLAFSASAEEAPVYDPSLGTYTESGGVLTATPYNGAGFRGWFKKDGTEVSYNTSFTIPSGTSASDYVPVFYNFNLIENGGFENYASGTNLSTGVAADEQWNGVTWEYINGTETSSWANKVLVTNAAAKTGNNSIVLNSPHHCTYKQIDNLKTNTQYTLTYYYNIVPTTTDKDYLSRSYIVSGDIAENKLLNGYSPNSANPYLDMETFDTTTGSCSAGEWKEVKHTFFTGENTSVKLLVYYRNEPVNNVRPPFYIDDVILVEDPLEVPAEYYNEDFSIPTVANWRALSDGLNLYHESGKLNVNATSTFRRIQNAPFFAKKGATYTVNFTFNIANLTDSGNYINFSLTTAKGMAVENGYYVQNSGESANFKAVLTQGSKTLDITKYYSDGIYSNTCIQQTGLTSGFDATQDITIALSFKANKNTPVYLNVWINGVGTYSIDNLTVTEDASGMDSVEFVSKSAASTVGTAIRTEGKQGMRYKTRIDKRLLTTDMYYGIRVIEYGTAAIKSDYVGNSDLVLGGEYDYNGVTYGVKTGVAYSFSEGIDKVFAEDEATLDFTGVLTNIREEYYNTDYTVRAYFKYVDKNGNNGIFYVDQSDIAVYPVSKAAYSARNTQGDFVETEELRNYLYENIISKYTDKVVKVYNDSEPVYSNFQGIRSTVYHGVTFFPDSHGRTYTVAQAATEMDRLVDTKVDNVRTRFDSNWMWTDSGWNWESTKMTAFYKWGKMLQDRDISITIQAGWHLYDFICFYNKKFSTGIVDSQDTDGDGHSSIPEVNYLHGYQADATTKATALYGEDANAAKIEADARALGLSLTDSEFAHYSVAAARYGEWIKQGITALKAHGVNNVEYVLPFTESGDNNANDEIYSYDEWIVMTMGLNNALKDAGLRNSVKFIGPAQSIYAYQNRLSMIEYVYSKIGSSSEYKNMIDINAMHQYTRPNSEAGYPNTVYDPEASYSMAEENFTYYDDVLTNSGVRNQEFWCDEYFAHSPDAKWWNNVGMQMTQFAAGLTAGINNGVNRFLTWQMFDCLWDSERTHGTGIRDNNNEFSGGVHAVGTCPSLVHVDGKTCPNGASCPCTANYNISSYVPRTTYYGINLIGKYMNSQNADVFEAEVINNADENGGVYVSAIKNDDGKTVILVVNTNDIIVNLDIQLGNDNASSFKRYTYDPNEIVPTAEAKSLPSDKTITLKGASSFADIIPAQSFAIYVEDGNFIGDDVNIPWFN